MAQEGVIAEFRSDDIPLVAWLKTKGYQPIGMRQQGKSFFVWAFNDSDDLRDEVDVYLSEEALVEPRSYSIILRETYRELPSVQSRNRRSRTA